MAVEGKPFVRGVYELMCCTRCNASDVKVLHFLHSSMMMTVHLFTHSLKNNPHVGVDR